MKFNYLILFAIFSFFLFSCDSEIKFENPNDQHNADLSDSDDSEQSNDTNVSDNDTSDTVDDSDTTPEQPDNGDTTPDNGDTAPDNGDLESDEDTDSADTADEDYTQDITDTSTEIGETRVHDCSELPENAQWNTVSAIVQSWDGEKWVPSSKASFNLEGSEDECRYKCATNYKWNSTNSTCDADTQQGTCSSKPANSVWNDNGANGKFTQTWDGSAFAPATYYSVYNTTPGVCHYKCATNYTWNESTSTCDADSRVSQCVSLPDNASWNTATSITQTWNGTEWLPSAIGSYNKESSTTQCRFSCNEKHFWDGLAECINPCDAAPCDILHATGDCYPFMLNNYSCECDGNYYWWGENKGCINKKLSLGNICTGHDKCYNNSGTMACPAEGEDFFGQDAQYAETGTCVPQSFTVQTISSQQVVVDNNTGLVWQQTIKDVTYAQSAAESYCNNLTYAGYSDWRLPTPQELLTIVDNSKHHPAINTTYFPDTTIYDPDIRRYFWSSSTYVNYTSNAWRVNFYYGDVDSNDKTNGRHYVRCVRGTLPTSSFNSSTVNGDVIVTDTKTELIWQKTYVSGKTWQQALSYCENLTYAGYSDWRLPNKNELTSLVNYGKYNPASDFPDMPSQYFWSSSFTTVNNKGAWYVNFKYGNGDSNSNKTNNYYVRCVRN